ncbi:MAG: ArsR/SmtB family transcription factor [Erythrobacter sp.]
MQEQINIADPAAAAFASPVQAKIVQTLIGEEMTASRLAGIVQLPLSLLNYHLAKCQKLGLVHIAREQPRAGRALKYYRAAARSFFVPSELLARLPGTDMTRQLRDALDRSQARSVQGVNFTHEEGHPRMRLVKDPSTASSKIEFWLEMGLTSADAAALIGELRAVVERFAMRGRDSEPRYLLHVAAVRSG